MLLGLNPDGFGKAFKQRTQSGSVRPEVFVDPYFSHAQTIWKVRLPCQHTQRVHAVLHPVHSAPR
jgi:hypothetical protein